MMSKQNCCSQTDFLSPAESCNKQWIGATLDHPHGKVLQIKTEWTRKDHLDRARARLSSFRMRYSVAPGLYAVGHPDENSPVLVSANYKLSFDELRRELSGLNVWMLVIDTGGINVWCAAGKGTFGTVEIVKKIQSVDLESLVKHRKIILPQLGAPGVHAHLIRKATGFSVLFGPIYARDIKAYLEAGYKATSEMRCVRFPLKDRIVLTPMELVPAVKKFWIPALLMILFLGVKPEGILFRDIWQNGYAFLTLGLISLFLGAFLVPLLLPYIPFRSFALKGLLVAFVFFGASFWLVRQTLGNDPWLLIAVSLLFPALISFLALNFTGATTFTNISGVRKELRISIPIYITAAAISGIFIVIHKLIAWGIL